MVYSMEYWFHFYFRGSWYKRFTVLLTKNYNDEPNCLGTNSSFTFLQKKNSIQASTFPKGDFIITSFLKHILKKLNITDLKWFVQFQCNRHPCWIFDNIRSIYPLFLCWCNKSVGISKRLKALASCIWLVDYNIFWYMIDWIVINICLEWKKQM